MSTGVTPRTDDDIWDDEPADSTSAPAAEPGRTTPSDDDWSAPWADKNSQTPKEETASALVEIDSKAEPRQLAVPAEAQSHLDEKILADLAVLDAPEPPPQRNKNIVPVTLPPRGDPNDLSLHEDIFAQKVPVRVIQHPRGGRRIIVGTGGGTDSYIAEEWVEKVSSVAPAHRDSRGRRIVMTGYAQGLRVRCAVQGRGTAYLMVTEQGLKLVKKTVYERK